MKRMLAVLLAAVLCLPALGAPAETVDLTQPEEFELMAYYVMDVPENDPILNYVEEKFNAKINLTITNINNYSDTLNMRVASDDIPDWFRITNQKLFNEMVEDGLLLNVSGYVERYDFSNIAATFEPANAIALSNDGVFYRVPDTLGGLTRGIYYRKDWLDDLGIAMPTNFDELAAALQAVVDADPDGKGTTGMTSYNLWCLEATAPSFLGYNTWGQKSDGSILYYMQDNQYRAFLTYWSDLYAKKLVDQELFVNSYETCMEKLASGRAGFYIMNMNTTWWSNNKMNLAQYDPDAVLGAVMPFPTGPAGSWVATYFGYSADSTFSAAADERKASRMLAVMDYLLSDEGRDLTLYGWEEGVYYDTIDGVKVQKEDVVNAQWGQVQHFLGEIADFGSNDRLARDPEVVAWYEYVKNPANGKSSKVDYMYNERASVLGTEISEVTSKYTTAFITGEMRIETDWDAFQADLEKAGIAEYTAIVKQYADDHGITFDSVLE